MTVMSRLFSARSLAPAVMILAALCAAHALAACGSSEPTTAADASAPVASTTTGTPTQAAAAPAPAAAPATVTTKSGTTVPRDSEEGDSSPLAVRQAGAPAAPSPADVKQSPTATASAAGGGDGVSPGAPSDAEVRELLREQGQVQATQSKAIKAAGGKLTLAGDGTAQAPPDAPEAILRLVSAANAIAKFPYVYGGGHGSFVDSAYDCSGSLSYALAAAGLLKTTKTSGELAGMYEPGQGKWITIFANDTHTFMYVGGLRYDTSGRDGPKGSRWQTAPRSLAGFTVRHPKGF
jgi:hypothetical protein